MNSLKILYLILLSSITFLSFKSEPYTINNIGTIDVITDHVLVLKDNSTTFDVVLVEGFENAKIVVDKNPQLSEIKVNEDNTFTIQPKENTCNKKDKFSYTLIKENKSKHVVVDIEILCQKLTFFNAIQTNPNAKPAYKILGIKAFPNHKIDIFNTWGENVFSATNYVNDWDGTSPEGNLIINPDHMYYYVFDDGQGKQYSGYITYN